MALKIKLTERQQKLAAGELTDEEVAGDAESLRSAGFDFADDDGENNEDSKDGDGNSQTDDGIEPSGEYIDEVPDDGNDDSLVDGDDDGGQSGGGGDADWIDDRVKEYATSYGLAEDEIKQFANFDELQRFGTIMDRRFASTAAGQSEDDREEQDGGNRQSGEGEGGTGSSQETQQKPSVFDRLKPLDRKVYEEAKYGENELNLIDQVNSVVEAIREIAPAVAFVQNSQKSQLEEQAQSQLREFDQTLDELDPVVFGKVYDGDKKNDKLSEAFAGNRLAVWETMERLSKGIVADAQRRGVEPNVPPVRILAQRAASIVAGNGSAPSRSSGVDTGQVASQSRKRRPVGSGGTKGGKGSGTRGSQKPMSDAEEVKAIANNPTIAKFFRDAQRENGAI